MLYVGTQNIMTLAAVVESAAFKDPSHPKHKRLMADANYWIDSNFVGVTPAKRANFLPWFAGCQAAIHERHPLHMEVMGLHKDLLGYLSWIHAPGALDAAPDPATASIQQLLTSAANGNVDDPLHVATRARIDAHYATLFGGDAPVL